MTSISNSASTAVSADQVTNFKVKVRILKESYQDLIEGKPDTYSPFRPGMTATVDIVTNTRSGVLTVPIAAVTTRSKDKKSEDIDTKESEENVEKVESSKKEKPKEIIFVHKNGKVVAKEIKTGITDTSAGTIEVISGLSKGEEIVIGPFLEVSKNLKDGDLVTTKKAEEIKK